VTVRVAVSDAVTERVAATDLVAVGEEVGDTVGVEVGVSVDVAERVTVRVVLDVGVREGVKVALAVLVGLILLVGVTLRVTEGEGHPGTEVAYWLRLLWQRPQCIVPVHRGFPQMVGMTQAPDSLLVGVPVASELRVALVVVLGDLEGETLGVIDAVSDVLGDTLLVTDLEGVSDAVGVSVGGLDGVAVRDTLGDRDSLGETDADRDEDGLWLGDTLEDAEDDGDTEGLGMTHVTWTGTLLLVLIPLPNWNWSAKAYKLKKNTRC
jgi:hypothetical protein